MSDDTIQDRMRWQIGQTTGLQTDAVLREGAELIDIQREEIAKLRAEVQRCHEYIRERDFPQPYQISEVIGKTEKLDYVLPIIRTLNSYPRMVIEVGLPFQPASPIADHERMESFNSLYRDRDR